MEVSNFQSIGLPHFIIRIINGIVHLKETSLNSGAPIVMTWGCFMALFYQQCHKTDVGKVSYFTNLTCWAILG